jgi:hypothetical protein
MIESGHPDKLEENIQVQSNPNRFFLAGHPGM